MGFFADLTIAFFLIDVCNEKRMLNLFIDSKIVWFFFCFYKMENYSYLPAAMNIITATMIVPQIAALAAIVILSMFDVADESVLTSRHCEYGTLSGVTFNSSNDITQTTIHSCGGTFLILNSRSLASNGGPCLKLLSANNR